MTIEKRARRKYACPYYFTGATRYLPHKRRHSPEGTDPSCRSRYPPSTGGMPCELSQMRKYRFSSTLAIHDGNFIRGEVVEFVDNLVDFGFEFGDIRFQISLL